MLFPNFRLFIFSSVVLSFNHLHLSWVSAQSDDIDNTDDGQQVSCPVCSSAFSEQPQVSDLSIAKVVLIIDLETQFISKNLVFKSFNEKSK